MVNGVKLAHTDATFKDYALNKTSDVVNRTCTIGFPLLGYHLIRALNCLDGSPFRKSNSKDDKPLG